MKQSRIPDEIIIAEDGEFPEMKSFLKKKNIPQLVHLTQEDLGWRKARSLNNAIKKASGDYLIFIDGDCLPHPRFIEGHIAVSEPSFVACGKRAELGENITKAIYSKEIEPESITTSFISKAIALHQDGVRHYEEGVYISAKNPLYLFLKNRHVRYIIGCNFSCYKTDFEKINGFDEDYTKPSVGEDIDLALSPAFGQVFYWDTLNNHGCYSYLWATQGNTWHAFDPLTGRWEYTMTNVPGGTRVPGPKGEILLYAFDGVNGRMTMWNSTAAYYDMRLAEEGYDNPLQRYNSGRSWWFEKYLYLCWRNAVEASIQMYHIYQINTTRK